MTDLRRRRKDPLLGEEQDESTGNLASRIDAEDRTQVSVLDVLRVLGGIFLLSSALSWFVTNDSIIWGFRPAWTRPAVIRSWLRGPVSLTDVELARYNGTDPSLPIYLAINGTIFDVSASPSFYGPGGSYHFFAGRDATRAYVTGCFGEDTTPDLRGAEEKFIPIDEPGDEEGLSKGELKKRREQDRRKAKKQVHDTVAHWERFFGNNKKYLRVGKVKREEGWLERLPRREMCETAKRERPKRKKG